MEDFALLREFQAGSEDAFARLVQRHVDAVYSVAFRTLHSQALAEEVAFSVFADLAKAAPRLKETGPLISWLFRVTRRSALDVLKREQRRLSRERVAAENDGHRDSHDVPLELADRLDAALEALSEADRELLLSRYFADEDLSFIAESRGISAEAAQKRVERALERLRECFGRQGVVGSTAGVAAVLSQTAVQSSPVAIAAGIALAAKDAATVSAVAAHAAKIGFMSTTQKAALVAIVTGVITTGIYQQSRISGAGRELRATAQALENTRTQLSEAEDKLRAARRENAQLREQNREIHRLRADLGELRGKLSTAAEPPDMERQESFGVREYLNGMEQLKTAFASRPEAFIPEMRLARDREWLEAAIVMRESRGDGLEKAMAHLRTLSKGKYALLVNHALQKFVEVNEGQLPRSPGELAHYLGDGADPAALVRYEVVKTGTTNEVKGPDTILQEKSRISGFDSQFNISLFGAGYASPKKPGSERTYGFSFSSDDLPSH